MNLRRRRSIVPRWLAALSPALAACGGAQDPSPRPAAPPGFAASPAPPAATPQSARAMDRAATPPAATAAPPAATTRERSGSFPPPAFDPPHQRSAREGDGRWKPLLEGEPPAAVRTTVHPHPISRYVPVVIAALDLERLELHVAPGLDDPESPSLPRDVRTGLVPAAEQSRLRFAFNGGFKTRHGRHGMAWQGTVLVPPLDDACTIAMDATGRVRIAPWPDLSKSSDLVSWRQTPPCLLVDGRAHPELDDATRRWGTSVEGKVKVRRSALGLDVDRRTLFYAVGEDVTARLLAVALATAGASSAAQLDINWSYTWFVGYRAASDGSPEVRETLLPKMKHHPRGLLTRPAHRDFFYVLARPSET